jgi:hypothetical protein
MSEERTGKACSQAESCQHAKQPVPHSPAHLGSLCRALRDRDVMLVRHANLKHPAHPNKRYYNTPSLAFRHLLEADPFLFRSLPPPPISKHTWKACAQLVANVADQVHCQVPRAHKTLCLVAGDADVQLNPSPADTSPLLICYQTQKSHPARCVRQPHMVSPTTHLGSLCPAHCECGRSGPLPGPSHAPHSLRGCW